MLTSIGFPGLLLLFSVLGAPVAAVVSHGFIAVNFVSMTALAEVHQ